MIAALFVETGGCYYNLPGVDPWDITRDARQYRGPHRVIAHPPCERWGRYAKGSPRNQIHIPGDDGGCFASALHSVRLWGGVLEHPAHSKAWEFFNIPTPPRQGWRQVNEREFVCSVEQGQYGHPARKPTWLIFCGEQPPELRWGPCAQRLPAKRLAERGYESARRCGIVANMSTKQRQRTPPAFRDMLLELAAGSHS